MIVRRSLRIGSVVRFTWRSNTYFVVIAFAAAAAYSVLGMESVAVPISAVGPLGTALAQADSEEVKKSFDGLGSTSGLEASVAKPFPRSIARNLVYKPSSKWRTDLNYRNLLCSPATSLSRIRNGRATTSTRTSNSQHP